MDKLTGKIFTRQYQTDDGNVVCVYGDPEGLRSLAKAILEIGDLDQGEIPERNLPETEGFHQHFSLEPDPSGVPISLIIGRLDAKVGGDSSWFYRDC